MRGAGQVDQLAVAILNPDGVPVLGARWRRPSKVPSYQIWNNLNSVVPVVNSYLGYSRAFG